MQDLLKEIFYRIAKGIEKSNYMGWELLCRYVKAYWLMDCMG